MQKSNDRHLWCLYLIVDFTGQAMPTCLALTEHDWYIEQSVISLKAICLTLCRSLCGAKTALKPQGMDQGILKAVLWCLAQDVGNASFWLWIGVLVSLAISEPFGRCYMLK